MPLSNSYKCISSSPDIIHGPFRREKGGVEAKLSEPLNAFSDALRREGYGKRWHHDVPWNGVSGRETVE